MLILSVPMIRMEIFLLALMKPLLSIEPILTALLPILIYPRMVFGVVLQSKLCVFLHRVHQLHQDQLHQDQLPLELQFVHQDVYSDNVYVDPADAHLDTAEYPVILPRVEME